MDPLEFLKSRFKAEDVPKLVLLSDLSLGIIKAMLRSGYYDPTHPSAQLAKAGLYEDFKKLIVDRENLSFFRKEAGEKKDILVDGLLPEPVELSGIMPHSTAELFIPRFLDFYERRTLLSYTIKKSISQNEFESFLDLMSQPPVASERVGAEADRLTQAFLDNGIINVSVIFAGDVVGADRHLPWRVELALTRLSKDLKMIPLYKSVDPKVIGRAKRQVFEDIIRPVRRPDFIKEILVNSDLVAEATREIREVDIENQIVNNIPEDMVLPTAREVVMDLDRTRKKIETGIAQEEGVKWRENRIFTIIKMIASRLLRQPSPDSEDLLSAFFKRKLVRFEDLPRELQEKIVIERMAEEFLAGRLDISGKLNSARTEKDYQETVAKFLRIFPGVVYYKGFLAVAEVIRIFAEHRDNPQSGFDGRQGLAVQALEKILSPTVSKLMRETFETGGKETRQEILTMLEPLGAGAISFYLVILKESPDRWVRKSVAMAIVKMGGQVLPQVIAEFQEKGQEWFVLRNLIGILAEIGRVRDAQIIRKFIDHPQARVREEALAALVRLVKEGSEPALVEALSARELSVRRKAVGLLAQIPFNSQETLARLLDIVRRRGKKEPEEDEALQIQACHTLAKIARPGISERIEEVLLGAISRERRLLLPTEQEKSDKVKLAIIQALGKVGSKGCVPMLRDLEKKGEKEIREAAKTSREEVEERLSQK